ncbi:MAG: hypothetical protein AAGC77_03020 [Pseudomonadota bacterium]
MSDQNQTTPAATPNTGSDHPKPDGFFDQPGTRTAIWIILIALCAGFAIAGFVIDLHGYFPIEEFGVFYGLFGFGVFSFIVLVGQHLRKILMRPEDYYDE